MTREGRPLVGKVAIVTGAASGIGAAAARLLGEAGAIIALLDCDETGMRSTAEAIQASGGQVLVVPIDLADAAAARGVVGSTIAALGRVDILVNVAGITGATTSLIETTEESWDSVYAVNIKAPFLLMQAAGRQMITQGQGGRIVNVTSSSAHRARRALTAYASSKAALAQLTRTAAAEWGCHDINVNAVAPGLTATPIVARNFTEESLRLALEEGPISNLLARVSTPEDIAETILFLCLPASHQITGQTIHVSAGHIV